MPAENGLVPDRSFTPGATRPVTAGADEIDYLIAPGLGGTEDIRNLWFEPYTSPTWNTHVKDTPAQHLHQ